MKFDLKNGGFSLIELMVVIVIMGILAAVGVPKLFGHMAKAKASEVYSAAGAYIALQDAFNMDNQTVIGSWGQIGYSMPGSSNFKYFEGSTEGGVQAKTSTQVSDGEKAAWKATNNVSLNDCASGSSWQIDIESSKEYRLVYQVKITGGANGSCGVLTTNLGSLSTANHIAMKL